MVLSIRIVVRENINITSHIIFIPYGKSLFPCMAIFYGKPPPGDRRIMQMDVSNL